MGTSVTFPLDWPALSREDEIAAEPSPDDPEPDPLFSQRLDPIATPPEADPLPWAFVTLYGLYCIALLANATAIDGWTELARFFPADGILLVLLWRAPSARLAQLVAAPVAMGFIMAAQASGWSGAVLAADGGRLAAVAICGLSLRYVCPGRDPIATLPGLGRVILWIGIVTPALLATVRVFFAAPHGADTLFWLHCFASIAPGLLTSAPMALILCSDPRKRGEWPLSRYGRLEAGSLLLLCAGVSMMVFAAPWPELGIPLALVVMFATLRFRQTGAAVATLIPILMIPVARRIIDVPGLPATPDPDLLQGYLAALFVMALIGATQLREHRHLVSRLRDSEARYRVLAEGSTDAVMLLDTDGTCLHVSPSIEMVLGYGADMLVDRGVGQYLHPDEVGMVREAALSVLARPEEAFLIEHRVLDRFGNWRWCETRLRALQENGRAPGGIACAIRDISEQRAREELLERRASIDALTGLLNRDSFRRELGAAMMVARAEEQALTLVFFDVDHFKRINDAHGHPAGDRVLQAIGEACAAVTRASDVAGRMGGEEFAIVLGGAGIAAATDVCRRLREAIAEGAALDRDGELIIPTVSIGIAAYRVGMVQDSLIGAADRALYAAKGAGRDCAFASIDGRLVRAL